MSNFNYILRENVLTNNVLIAPRKGFLFKGRYVAIVKENTFLNAWQDKETIRRFRSRKQLRKYLDKNYKGEIDHLDFFGSSLEEIN